MNLAIRDASLPVVTWLEEPWAQPLLQFNLLPTTLLHSSWHAKLAEIPLLQKWLADKTDLQILHRHWSSFLLKQYQLDQQWALNPEEPLVALACAPTALFNKALMLCGIVLIGKRVRQAITRTEILEIEKKIDAKILNFIYRRSIALFDGLTTLQDWSWEQLAKQMNLLSSALFLRAAEELDVALLQRLRWRLPANAEEFLGQINLSAQEAFLLLQKIVNEVDASWLSSFPKK